MKKIVFTLVLALGLITQVAQAQSPRLKVGTNSTNMQSSAVLEVQSATQGFLPPRMTLSQISAIASPAEGLSVYCTDCIPKALLSFDAVNWVNANGELPLILQAPNQATGVTATPNVGSAIVSFTEPVSNNGGAVVSYTVFSSPGGLQATGASSPIVVPNLVAGTPYTFFVRATNRGGLTSTSSPSSSITPLAGKPQPPTSLVVSQGIGSSASVAFSVPTSNGGAPITGYTVTSNPGGFTGTGASSPITVSGLTIGTTYVFTVVATNAQGDSSPSAASSNFIPAATVPAAPAIGTATVSPANPTTASVVFTAPANNGGAAITGYTVTSSPGGFTGTGTASPINVTGLLAGTTYNFTVTATNSAGTSIASGVSNNVLAIGVPGVPGAVSVTGTSETTASVSFSPSNTNGSAITSYTVTPSPATSPATFTATTSPIAITGLTTGTPYTISVTATNAVGTSTAAVSASFTPQAVAPGSPSAVTAVAGEAEATVSFTAPTNTGGTAITGYTVTSNPGGITATGTSSPIVVTGLTNGTSYTFTAVATNAVGNSSASGASNVVIPVAPSTVLAPVLSNNNITTIASYALRKLNSNFTGSAIQVRRSSDNTTQDIGFDANGNLDVIALTTFVGAGNDGFVAIWYDQSGNARNATQVAAEQPQIVTSGSVQIDGTKNRPSIYWNNKQLNATIPPTNFNAMILNAVSSNRSSSDGSVVTLVTSISDAGNIQNTYRHNGTSTFVGRYNGTSWVPNSNPNSNLNNNLLVGSVIYGASNSLLIKQSGNFVLSSTLNDGSSLNAKEIRLGKVRPGDAPLTGYIAEVHVLQSSSLNSLSTLEADQIVYYNSFAPTTVLPNTSPSVPSSVTAIAGNGTATVAFTLSSPNITSYTVTSNPGVITATGTSSPIQVNGLTNDQAYTFTVTATNEIGTSIASAPSTAVTPIATVSANVSGPPTAVTASVGTLDKAASVSFTAPANNGNATVTNYTVTSNPGGFTASGTSSPIVVSGLTANTAYTFTVVATNSIGNSTPSSPSTSVTAITVPSKPVLNTPTTLGLLASIPVTVSNNGSAITTYTATLNPGNITFNSFVSPVAITFPSNGSYSVTVTATNSVGTSVASDALSINVAALTAPVLASAINIANSSGETFNLNNKITSTTVISVGSVCPSSVTWEGVIYPTANVSGMCWMKTNFKGSNSLGNSAFFGGGTTEPSPGWGKLYDYTAIMNGQTAERSQGICPTGWHIPSDLEWNFLEHSVGVVIAQQQAEFFGLGGNYDNVGFQLRQSSSLGLLLSGSADFDTTTSYIPWNPSGLYWTSTGSKSRWTAENYTTLFRFTQDSKSGISLRCLKD